MKRLLLYFMPVAAVFFWSVNNVVTKVAASSISPGAVSFYRWALAALILTPFFIRQTITLRKVILKNLLKLIILAALGMVVYQSLGYIAAHYTSASNIGIILGLMPLVTFITSMFVFRLKLTMGAVLGIPASLYGILFFLSNGHPLAIIHHGFGKGDLYILIATCAYSMYGVLVKYWKIPLPTWVFIYIQTIIATLMLLPWFAILPHTAPTWGNFLIVIYAGTFASVLSPALWVISVGKLGAHNAAVFMNLIPVFTLFIAVFSLGEQFYWQEGIGAAIIFLGVMLSQLWTTPVIPGADIPLQTKNG